MGAAGSSGEIILSIIIMLVFAFGTWRGWRQLTKRIGFVGSKIKDSQYKWLQQDKTSSKVVKIIICVIFGWFYLMLIWLIIILYIFSLLFRTWSK